MTAPDTLEDFVDIPENDQLKEIADLAVHKTELEQAIARLKELTTTYNMRLVACDEQIAEAMMAANCKKFTLEDGRVVTYRLEWRGQVTPEGAVWLEENGHGGLLKDTIQVQLGRGEHQLAQKTRSLLDELNVPHTDKLDVPWNTLASWIKEQHAQGHPIPDVLNPRSFYTAKVK